MAENEIAIVKPSLLGMFVVLIVSNLGFAAGLFLSCGLGWISAVLLGSAFAGSVLLFLLGVLLLGRDGRSLRMSRPTRLRT